MRGKDLSLSNLSPWKVKKREIVLATREVAIRIFGDISILSIVAAPVSISPVPLERCTDYNTLAWN